MTLTITDQRPTGWQAVCNLPPSGLMVLVKGLTHQGVALGCCDENGKWDVQPYKDVWYFTEQGIREWAYIMPYQEIKAEVIDTISS